MEDDQDFDTSATDGPVCPHCGHEHDTDAHDDKSETARISCHECDEEFDSVIAVEVTYSTYKIDPAFEAAQLAKREEERRKLIEHRAAIHAACLRFTPGMRVRVKEDAKFSYSSIIGKEGTVANVELPRDGRFVTVEFPGMSNYHVPPHELEEML